MTRISHWFKIVFVFALLFVSVCGMPVAQAAPFADEDMEAQIANAMSAAPMAISHDATILGWDEEGMPTVVLQEGSNGWTCMADWPDSPTDDPQCSDPIWTAFMDAYAAGEEPVIDGMGISYMLQGGADPSASDPFAPLPDNAEAWVISPPHLMFLMPEGFDADFYATTPSASVPYIMWDGTPYEHLMVPVVAITAEEMGEASGEMASAMSAAPAEIALNATIMGNSETAGDPMIVLQEGTNGWICYPDGIGSPGNDPACQDPDFDAGFANAATTAVPGLRIGYMLQGGSDPSNTDPTLSAPAEGEEWVSSPAHVMVMVPGGFDVDYFSTDHMAGYPYIMFAGTDFEHMMIPVADMPEMDMAAAHAAEIEQMKAEAIEMELLTFDLMIVADWDGYAAVTHPDFYQFGTDGAYIERDDALAGLADPMLVVHAPNLGEMRVLVVAPNAYMVTYQLTFNGSYDGFEFRNPRTVASLWVKDDGEWQNLFLVDQLRTAPFVETTASRIANAERAGTSAVAQDATILDWDEDGSPTVVLREGTNGWTCITDWPVSPGNDPQCNDANWQKWSEAFGAGDEPEITGVGISYMLAGGSDPSNTDPMAMSPAEGEEWVSTPPHVMLLFPDGFDAEYFSTEPKQDEPYIMWDGTPYEHLMIPVVAITAEEMGDVSDDMRSAMSSSPASIAQNATIMGNPEKEGDPMVVLQEGTNGWVCYPDRAVSPGDDPSCNDPIMEAGFASGATRDVPGPGLGYMLAGGSDESNTDPTASGPADGEEWVTTPAHLMLMVPGGFDADYFTTDHMSGYPYIMFAGTDYEHMMIPVADMPEMEMEDARIMIPNGFQPEGIAVGQGGMAYVSSVGSGAIYKVNLATGEGSFFVEPQKTQKALGMVYDQRTDLLYVAGHSSGNGMVFNGLTGELVANVQFTTDPDGLVNDVALADDVVYFTDSNLPLVYRLPLTAESHQPDPSASQTISLTGEFEHLSGGINGNGIVATADGATLIIAHTDLGKLYTVDAASGAATELALDGEVEIYHDGLVLAGDTLYIVNYNDKIYEIALAPDWMSGTLVRTVTDPMLEAPATAAIYDDALYVVNARWDAEQTPDTEFWLIQLKR
ncbi:MAG: DUF4440 domain-containing protein [Caldilineaceae bacterium]|nr:DUF4440 domain-containing protein [Caldilineaceae bacterium]